jgi:hypothetical protein
MRCREMSLGMGRQEHGYTALLWPLIAKKFSQPTNSAMRAARMTPTSMFCRCVSALAIPGDAPNASFTPPRIRSSLFVAIAGI